MNLHLSLKDFILYSIIQTNYYICLIKSIFLSLNGLQIQNEQTHCQFFLQLVFFWQKTENESIKIEEGSCAFTNRKTAKKKNSYLKEKIILKQIIMQNTKFQPPPKKKKMVVDTKMRIMDTNKQNYTEGLTLFWDSSTNVDVISYIQELTVCGLIFDCP